MLYREFVKLHFHQLPAHLKATEKMRQIGKLWRKSGHSTKKASGKGLGSTIGSIADSVFGLGMEKPKKTRGRPKA